MNEKYLWEFAELIAIEKYHIEINGERKTSPALLVISFNKKYCLYLNHIGKIGCYKSKKEVHNKIKELVETANYPLKLWKGLKSKKPFAENTQHRVDVSKINAPLRVFNIPEWRNKGG